MANKPNPEKKVERALADLQRAEIAMLRRAVQDLQRAEQTYIERYEAWVRGPRDALDVRLFELQQAEHRVDEARMQATQWEAATRERPRR